MLELFVGVFGCFGLSILGTWALLKYLDAEKAQAKAEDLDPPAFRSFAILDLQPSGSWQQLDAAVIEAGGKRFDGLLDHLRACGIAAQPRITEDWGELGVIGPFEVSFSSLDDGSGWMLCVERSGKRALNDSPPTRQLLTAIDQALQRMTDVKAVRWRKREDVNRGVKVEPTAHPFDGTP